MKQLIINYNFDVTEYLYKYPGGKNINKDATEAFNEVRGHSEEYCLSLLDKFYIGKIIKYF